MFSTSKSLQLKQIKPNNLSNIKQDLEITNNSVENSKILNQNNNNFTNIVIKPNDDIPKTIYYKRMYQKLIQPNETSDFNHKIPIEKYNHSNNNKTQDKYEEFNNDNISNIIPLDHNESKENFNSTLIIVESEVSSDHETNIPTPVSKCENPEKVQENISIKSLTPTTIGVENMPHKTLKCVSNLNEINNINSKIHHISNLPENKIIESLNVNSESICTNECYTKDNLKSDNEQFVLVDIVHKQKSTNFDEISPINNEVKKIPSIQKPIEIENTNNNLKLTENKTSCTTCINPLISNKLNKSNNDNKCASINNEKELSSLCKQKKNESNDIAKSITEKSCSGQTCKSFINIDVEQIPIRKKRTVIKIDNSTSPLITKKKSSHVTCINSLMDNNLNVSNKNIKKKVSNSFNQNIGQSECKLPIMHVNNLPQSDDLIINETNCISKTDKPSYNIEVEQIPFKRKLVVVEKINVEKTLNEKKNSHVTHINSLGNNEKALFNSSKQINNKSHCDSSIVNLQKKTIEKNAVKNTDLLSINIEVEQGAIFRQSNKRKVIMHSNSQNSKQETKKGRRIQLITIKNHYSQPAPSFNGAKKKEIDVSQKSIHIEKEVESSSQFYIPQVKRRRTMNFSSND